MGRVFNGSTDVAYFAGLPNTQQKQVTLSCWAYPTLVNSTEQVIFSVGVDTGVVGSGYAIEIDTTNHWSFLIPGILRSVSASTVVANQWYHLALTGNSTNHWNLLVNNVQVRTNIAATALTPTVGVSVGAQFNSATPTFFRNFTGRVAEASWWSVDLAQSTANPGFGEIDYLAHRGLPWHIRPSARIAYWPLWGLGSVEPDFWGPGNNLTLVGTAFADHAPVQPRSVRLPFAAPPATPGFFRQANLVTGAGGPFFVNPIG